MIIFARSLSGLEWDSPDGSRAQFIFLILTPAHQDAVQVQILQGISKVMQKAENRYELSNANDISQIWDVFVRGFDTLYIESESP